MKTNLCKEKGIKLIHIFEDEWIHKKEIVKFKLKQILNISNDKKINLNKYKIKEVSNRLKNKFLEKRHIGENIESDLNLGLFHNNNQTSQLSNIMTFSKKDRGFELIYYPYSYEISKHLLNYFQENYNWKEIYSCVDLRWSDGEIYHKLKFEKLYQKEPECWNIVPRQIKRIRLSESEDLLKIYDCGSIYFKLINKENING